MERKKTITSTACIGSVTRIMWRRSLVELGTVMCEAYDVEADGLVGWWAARLPKMPTTVAPVGLG